MEGVVVLGEGNNLVYGIGFNLSQSFGVRFDGDNLSIDDIRAAAPPPGTAAPTFVREDVIESIHLTRPSLCAFSVMATEITPGALSPVRLRISSR